MISSILKEMFMIGVVVAMVIAVLSICDTLNKPDIGGTWMVVEQVTATTKANPFIWYEIETNQDFVKTNNPKTGSRIIYKISELTKDRISFDNNEKYYKGIVGKLDERLHIAGTWKTDKNEGVWYAAKE